jgi:hypothetical protein
MDVSNSQEASLLTATKPTLKIIKVSVARQPEKNAVSRALEEHGSLKVF